MSVVSVLQADAARSGITNPLPPSIGSHHTAPAAVATVGSGNGSALSKSNASALSASIHSIVVVKSSGSSSGLQPSPEAERIASASALAAQELRGHPADMQQQQQNGFSYPTDTFVPVMTSLQQQQRSPQGSVVEDTSHIVSGHVCHDISEFNLPSYQEQQQAGDSNARSGSSLGVQGRSRAKGSLAEAQTWLILEYCDQGTLLDRVTDGQMHDDLGKPCMVGAGWVGGQGTL